MLSTIVLKQVNSW